LPGSVGLEGLLVVALEALVLLVKPRVSRRCEHRLLQADD